MPKFHLRCWLGLHSWRVTRIDPVDPPVSYFDTKRRCTLCKRKEKRSFTYQYWREDLTNVSYLSDMNMSGG